MRYFQYLAGENRGKVTTLTQVDDTLDIILLYEFEDGFRCNHELIAPLNASSINGKVMAEVESPNVLWRFEEKEIVPNEFEGITKDGEKVIAADPYFMDKNGSDLGKMRKEIKIIPPRKSFKDIEKIDPISNYLLSLKNEKKHEETSAKMPDHNSKSEPEIKQKNEPIEEINDDERLVATNSDIMQTFILPFEESKFVIDFGNMPKRVKLVLDDKEEELDTSMLYSKIVSFLNIGKSCEISTEKQTEDCAKQDTAKLLNKCKKFDAEVEMTLAMKLPHADVYKTIKENYPEGYSQAFIENIVHSIPDDWYKEAIIKGLIEMYDSQISECNDSQLNEDVKN